MSQKNTRRELRTSINCPTIVLEKYKEEDRKLFHPGLDWASGKYTTKILYTWSSHTNPPRYSHFERLAEVPHPVSSAMVLEHFGEGTYKFIINGPYCISGMKDPITMDLYSATYNALNSDCIEHDEMPKKKKNNDGLTLENPFANLPYVEVSGIYENVGSVKDVVLHNSPHLVKGECVNIFELDQDEIEQHINWASLRYHSYITRTSPLRRGVNHTAGHLGCFAHDVTLEFIRKNFGGGFYLVRIRGPMRLSDGGIGISLIKQKTYSVSGEPIVHPTDLNPPSFLHDANKVFSRLYEQSSHDPNHPIASYKFLIDKKFVMGKFPPGSYMITVLSDGPGVQAGWLLHEESFTVTKDDIENHFNPKKPPAKITDEDIEKQLTTNEQLKTTPPDRFTLIKALISSGCFEDVEEG